MNWKEIYKNLDPKEPLEKNDRRLCKNLFGNHVSDLAELISVEGGRNQKFLFSGNIGSGKSTFLNLLEKHQKIEKEFSTVKFSIKDILDPNDTTHIDLLLCLTIKTFEEVTESEMEIGKDLMEKVQTLALKLAGLIEEEKSEHLKSKLGVGAELGVGVPKLINWFNAGLFGRYRLEKETREEIRRHYKTRITELLNAINDILDRVNQVLDEKKLLILIDDTDKIPPDQGLKIFRDNGHHLSALNSNMLFIIDTSLSCFDDYPITVSTIGKEWFFSAVKIQEKDGGSSKDTEINWEILQNLVHKRIPKKFIEKKALEKAIKMSGGVVRELIRILEKATFSAKGKIREDHIDYAVIEIRNRYNLRSRHTKILKKILDNPDWLTTSEEDTSEYDEIIRKLLWMPTLFNYRNGEDKWYRPYPVFIPWLQKLQND